MTKTKRMLPLCKILIIGLAVPFNAFALPQAASSGQGDEPVYEKGPVISSNFPDPCIVEDKGEVTPLTVRKLLVDVYFQANGTRCS